MLRISFLCLCFICLGTFSLKAQSLHTGDTDPEVEEILANNEPVVFIPNAFTPDGNDLNALFKPVLLNNNVEEYDFQIFDRSGQLVFRSVVPGEGWNGSINGGDYYPSSGNFVYVLRLKNHNDPITYTHRGRITLLR